MTMDIIPWPQIYELIVREAGGPAAIEEQLTASADGLPDPHDERGISLKCVRAACYSSGVPFGRVMQWLESKGCHCDLEVFANALLLQELWELLREHKR